MDLHVDAGGSPLTEERVRAAVRATEEVAHVSFAEVGVRVVDDPEMAELNSRYAGRATTTDVLSFPLGEAPGGDIVISLPEATRQAAEARAPLADELVLLFVHGLLHLAGRDHAEESDKAQMDSETAQILKSLATSAREYL